jgi:hypothetical protein
MGLDMYFTAKRYVSDHLEEDKVLQTKVKDIVAPFVPEWSVKEVSYRVGYWRKANAIHNWFVQNVQDGEDDCKEYYVCPDYIQELYDVVCEVLESGSAEVAADKLPPQSGFFFGGTEIDEWYFSDLEYTKRMLQPLIDAYNQAKELGPKSYTHPIYQYEFYYQSSW